MKKEYILYIAGGILVGYWLGYRKYYKVCTECPKQIDCYEGKYVTNINEAGRVDWYDIYLIKDGFKIKQNGKVEEDMIINLSTNKKDAQIILVTNDFLNKYPTK